MSISNFSHSMKLHPVLRSLAALPLIAGWLFSGGFRASTAVSARLPSATTSVQTLLCAPRPSLS